MLLHNDYDNILICGWDTDICVNEFTKSLTEFYKNKKDELVEADVNELVEPNIYVLEDAVDTYNAIDHNADEVNKNCLSKFEKEYGAKIISTDRLVTRELSL